MPRSVRLILLVVVVAAVAALVYNLTLRPPRPKTQGMDDLAERYVRLVLALGQHDPDYVDAYYGPPEWRTEAEHAKVPLKEIDAAAADLAGDLQGVAPPAAADELIRLRHQYVSRQLAALRARVSMLQGTRLRFDEESQALYDAVAPTHTEAEFEGMLAELDKRLPGTGSVLERYDTFRQQFVIPRDRLAATFTAAIDGCRSRTLQHIKLPADEAFTVEYVAKKSWSAYNWYKGGFRSLIQVNTDLPVYADGVVTLACHEGYPGHHVYNVLLEKHFVRDRGWQEFTVYALFSPQSLIAEGTADYGVGVAFPPAERVAFERDVIFPAAGLDTSRAAEYAEVVALVEKLSYAGNEAARRYIDGEIDKDAAAAWLEKYALLTRPRAEQRMRFLDQYRSYVINYNLGEDMVGRWIESQGGTAANPERRWELFEQLISSPRLPSALAVP
jgi:hypothetical protein